LQEEEEEGEGVRLLTEEEEGERESLFIDVPW
jgi:hypothetical protein